MDSARLIVCERSGRWAAALRRELSDLARSWEKGDRHDLCEAPCAPFRQTVPVALLPVRETRSLAECWEALAEAPASLLVIELARGSVDGTLARLARLGDEFPLARAAMVADRSLADYQWLAREAGAVHFTCSPRQLAPLAELASRHLALAPAPVPRGTTEQLWARLPWRQHA